MARPSRPVVPSSGAQWLVSGLLLAAIGIALWGFTPVLKGGTWWFQPMILGTLVLLAGATVRSFAQRRIWPTLAAAGVALATMTFVFTSSTALLGVIPTLASFGAFRELEAAGVRDIAGQSIPANATEGILYLICLGVVIIAVVADACAHLLRMPALAGVPILVLLLVPGFVRAEFVDPILFALAAVVWLAAMVVYSRPTTTRTAVGVGAAAVVTALVLPFALPAVEPPSGSDSPGGNTLATGLNPIITLGDDLRRGNPQLALTYQTSDGAGQYLRLTVLDDFSGESWEPRSIPELGNSVDDLDPAPGTSDGVPSTRITSTIKVANVLSRWLPVPYAAEEIRGLEGAWSWEPEGLTVRTERSNAQGQQYEVESLQATPSVEQLVASGSGPIPAMDRFTELPAGLPEIVGQTAVELTTGLASNYDRALALQEYFRGGLFTYSEEAPVEQGFDGSGAEVLGPFLDVKSGYCVHFSSAMAAMARTLGIPSRVVVGFTPGQATKVDGTEEIIYRVTTHNLHAWPELYFDGIGWVRFEPTPGRGTPPAFAPLDEDDPSTPDVDESVPPPPADEPTDAPTPTAGPELPDEEAADPEGEAASPDAATGGIPLPLVISALALLLLITPAVIRAARRSRRLAAVGNGSALDGWDELRDTAYDLGLASDITLTPRQLTEELAPTLDDDGVAALARLRTALESQAFARDADVPAPRDLRRVIASLRRGSGVGRTLVAAIAPKSLVRDWLPGLLPR